MVRRAPVFEKENALPGAELHSIVGDWDHFARAGQDRPDMRGAVVGTFGGMFEIRSILRDEALKEFFEITAGGWIGVFHDDQAATGVPNENRDQAGLDPALRNNSRDALSDFVSAFSFRGNGETGSVNRHLTLVL